ncbi:TRAP transporter small permease subunit [Epibacterium sp. SM1969]|uniref:TRAP transporter small permease protein n=1 Tax=Tritonibacter aquimaris TaxID=2663379 RepID=A0A844B324_9RHOB|nr:TRAP transporter small permease subunit [Tritonibacter aquimaris]MQY43776.1 TRAP transporter small permease subunit [Tritonibacter aquimaris]
MRDWQPFLGLPLWVWLFVFPTLLALYCLWQGPRAVQLLGPVWRGLDAVYKAAGVIAAGFMVTILLLIILQMVARWTSSAFPGATEYAGYAMAATSFFALAHTLVQGGHIRVSVLLQINAFTRFWLDALAMFIAAVTATYFARYAIKTNIVSEMINDRTQGQDFVPEWLLTVFSMFATAPAQWGELWAQSGSEWVPTPIWLPQLPMSIGAVLLAIAIWDYLTRLLAYGESQIQGEVVE